MFQFHNVGKTFILLQPLDNKDVVPFPAGSTLPLTEAQTRLNCRDLNAFMARGKVKADETARALVAEALDELKAKPAQSRKAARKG